jgi:phosphonate transport system ATP-binding protein
MAPAAIALDGLEVRPAPGAAPVLRGVDLRVAAGEQIAVIGASGAGKTTLLLALAGMLRPSAVRLALFGQTPWTLDSAARQALRARVLLAPQVPPLPPRQRVVTAVLAARLPRMSLGASLRTLWSPRPADAERVQQALAALDLPDKLWLRVDRLSGGERQRVGLARLLVAEADVWLVDEPLSALDPVRAELVVRRLTAARWCARCTRWRWRGAVSRARSRCARGGWSTTDPRRDWTMDGCRRCMAGWCSRPPRACAPMLCRLWRRCPRRCAGERG